MQRKKFYQKIIIHKSKKIKEVKKCALICDKERERLIDGNIDFIKLTELRYFAANIRQRGE